MERGADVWFLRLSDVVEESLAPDAAAHDGLRALGVRVPEVVHLEHFAAELQRSVMIMRDIGGTSLATTISLQTLAAREIASVARAAGSDLARINQVPVRGFGWIERRGIEPGAIPWPPTAELPDYRAFVVDDLPSPWPGAFAEWFSPSEVARLEAIVRSELDRTVDQALLAHGDFALDHIFQRDGQYTGIIDFGELRGTEPLFDLGVFGADYGGGYHDVCKAVFAGYDQVAPLPPDADALIRTASLMKSLRHLGMWLQPTFTLERNKAWFARRIADELLPAAERARTG